MYPVSDAYKAAIKSTERTFQLKIAFNDGEGSYNFTDADVVQGSLTLEEACMDGDQINIGAAVSSDFSVTILDPNKQFANVILQNSSIDPSIGLALPDGTVEFVKLGHFNIDEAVTDYTAHTISIKAADDLLKLDVPFSNVKVSYPVTLGALLQAICTACGVELASNSFVNSDYSIKAYSPDDTPTCRTVVSYIAQLAGSWARMSPTDNSLELCWFDSSNATEITGANRYDLSWDRTLVKVTGIAYTAQDNTDSTTGGSSDGSSDDSSK